MKLLIKIFLRIYHLALHEHVSFAVPEAPQIMIVPFYVNDSQSLKMLMLINETSHQNVCTSELASS